MKNLFNKIKATYKTVEEYLERNATNFYFALSILISLGIITFWENDKYLIIHMHSIITILFCLMIALNIVLYALCFQRKFLDIRLALLAIELKEIEERISRNNEKIKEYEARIKVLEELEGEVR